MKTPMLPDGEIAACWSSAPGSGAGSGAGRSEARTEAGIFGCSPPLAGGGARAVDFRIRPLASVLVSAAEKAPR